MSGKDNRQIKDALAAVQREQYEGVSQPEIADDDLDDSIISSLPDDEIDDEVESKGKNKKEKVKQPSGKNKSNKTLKVAFFSVATALVGTVVAWQSGLLNNSSGTSFPKAGGWKVFGNNESETSSYVTQSDLAIFEKQLREDVLQTLTQLPTMSDIQVLKQNISTLRQLQNMQSSTISELNMLADKAAEKKPLIGSNYDSQISLIRSELNNFTAELLTKSAKLDESAEKFGEATKKIDELTNSNWINYLNLKKLEKQISSISDSNLYANSEKSRKSLKSAETITLKPKIEWFLKIVGERFSQIQNKQTGEKLRVFEGVVIPNCGPVIDIDVQARKVVAQHCTIGRN